MQGTERTKPKSDTNLIHDAGAIFKTGNKESGIGNGERGMGPGNGNGVSERENGNGGMVTGEWEWRMGTGNAAHA